jgi:hypothetical protein
MGLFVSVSAVISVTQTDVARALSEHVHAKHGIFQAEPRSPDDDDTMVIASANGNTTLLFPGNDLSWWETSQALSKILTAPVFAFHIHDSDLWMYELYKDGQKIDGFNPLPDYWMEISAEERRAYRGNAQMVAACVPGVDAAAISNYFVTWDVDADAPDKAYPTDKYACGDEWQLLDFMKKLKLPYPLDAAGKPAGPTYEFIIPSPPKPVK